MLAFRVVHVARSILCPDGSLAFQDADVVVGLLICRANGGIFPRATSAVVFIGTFAVTLTGNSTALPNALIEISPAINSAFWSVQLGAVFTIGFIQIAQSVVHLPHSLAVQKTLIVICHTVTSANRDIAQGLGASAVR